jgi:thiol-disulfide isomerase/thioredoxin
MLPSRTTNLLKFICALAAFAISQKSLNAQAVETPLSATRTDAKTEPQPNRGLLRLVGGDMLRGDAYASDTPDTISWLSPTFLSPSVFPWPAVELLDLENTHSPEPLDENTFCAELQTGEAFSGRLISIDPENVVMDIPTLGEKKVETRLLRHLIRLSRSAEDSTQVFQSADWEQVLPAPKNGKATKWYLKAGEISTDTSGTTISQWANMPALATIDIDVAWDQGSPNWWLTIGDPRRLELQVRKLQNKKLLNVTLLVENSKTADVATVQLPYDDERSLKLKLLCDANKAKYVLMQENQILGTLNGNPTEQLVGRTKVSFTNTALGLMTLRDLRISNSAFAIPSAKLEGVEILTKNAGTFFGSLASTSAERTVKLDTFNGTQQDIALDSIERMEFPRTIKDETSPDAVTGQPTTAKVFRVELANGLRFASSNLQSSVTKDSVSQSDQPAIRWSVLNGEISMPLMHVDRVTLESAQPIGAKKTVSTNETSNSDARTASQNGPAEPLDMQRLITDDVVAIGRIVSVINMQNGLKALAWQAKLARNPVPINPRSDGAIEPLITNPGTGSPKKARSEASRVLTANGLPAPEADISRPLKALEPNVFLVSGDCFPATIESSTVEQLYFNSPLFETKSIGANMVRGIRLVDYTGAEKIDRSTRNHLLTLPRLQRKNPPTHLVVSRDGDLLRGKLTSLDRDQLEIDVRGERRTILVKNIAELVWLEPVPTAPSKIEANGKSESESIREAESTAVDSESPNAETVSVTASIAANPSDVYQIILEQGSRISIVPEAIEGDTLKGTHPSLGPCTLKWGQVSRIVLGDSIRIDASRGRYGKWKLQNAQDPKYVSDDGEGGDDRPSDTAHARMIGKESPDFDLLKIDGTPCQLKDYRGKIVIIDFWASWCGPCVRSMPLLLELSREYHDLGVELILINVEESEERIRKFLERIEVTPTVAMDTDGSVSKQYAVSGIPQTVIVDRDGGIANILVGASEESEIKLRKTLDELTARATKP